MKNILLLVHDDSGQDARLQAALDLTRAVGGHLTCLDVVEVPMMVDTFGGGGEMVLLHDARAREAEHKARVKARLAQEDVSWSFLDGCGDIAACVIEAAGTADAVVLNRKLDSFPAPDMRGIASDVLIGTDALILAVADDCPRFDATARALIAWDGSTPAMNAIQRAMPLLSLAADLKLVQVGARDAGIPVEDAAAYISRHGRTVEVEMVAKDGPVARTLQACADDWRAGWLVMGAYKHRPTTEALFGGVTRTMLSAARLPLLLAH